MSACLLALFCFAVLGAARSAEAQPGAQRPVEAELLSRVTARTVRAGDLLYARVTADWKGDGCTLRHGSTLEGTVLAARPRRGRGKHSELVLVFRRAECGGTGLQNLALRLEALGAPADLESSLVYVAPMSAQVSQPTNELGFQAAERAVTVPRADPRWRTGQVVGIGGLKLSAGTGPDGSSVLTSVVGDVMLDPRTRLILLPDTGGDLPLKATAPAAAEIPVLSPATLVAEPPAISVLPEDSADDAGRCRAPACAPSDLTASPPGDGRYAGSIPLSPLGFAARVNMAITEPSEDEALAWLGSSELLVAFNPHELVPRHGVVSESSCIRLIRAVLIDTRTRTVLRRTDWQLADKRQFLWVLPGNRVLVHVENELRVYGSGLRLERRIELGGALAFARVSPDGQTIALGIVRERHTPELHFRLAAILDKDPEEDVEVLVLDGRFKTIGSAMSTSDKLAPALLNEGEVSLAAAPGEQGRKRKHYALELHSWSGSARNLLKFSSECPPELSTLAPDMAFLQTCDDSAGSRTYRVLRADGTLVRRGQSAVHELGQAASGRGDAAIFAVRVFEADGPFVPGEPFNAADLLAAELNVFRSQDGKHLFRVRVKDPEASRRAFALSARGDVAVLAQDGVEIYAGPQ